MNVPEESPDPERLVRLHAMLDRRTFEVFVARAKQPVDEVLLLVSIPEVDRVTRVRNLSSVETMARKTIAVVTGLPMDGFDIAIKAPPGLPSVTLPHDWTKDLAQVRALADKRAEMLKRLDEEMAMRLALARIVIAALGLGLTAVLIRRWVTRCR